MKIGFLGDLILSEQNAVSNSLLAQLLTTDFNVANLEASFINDGFRPRQKAGLHHLTKSVGFLKKLNIKAVSLANNHMLDFGCEAVQYTINHLKQNGIECFGAGENAYEAAKPCIIMHRGNEIALYGAMQKYYSDAHFAKSNRAGVLRFNADALLKDALVSDKRINILYLHWNQEFEDYPEPVSKMNAERLTSGFQVVVGSHPHCIHGIDERNHALIAYSLGNFALPHQQYCNVALPVYPSKSYDSLFLKVNFDDHSTTYEAVPLKVDPSGSYVDLHSESEAIKKKIASLSKPLLLNDKEYGSFYLQNRFNKKRPVLSGNSFVNSIWIGSYIGMQQSVQKIEIGIARILEFFHVRALAKRVVGKVIKRYQ
jgi:poly-gamma-glutamate synthesis protein (capsule biosynthesis protein)